MGGGRAVRRLVASALLTVCSACTAQQAQREAGPWPPPGGRLVLEDFEWCPLEALPRFWSSHPDEPAGNAEIARCAVDEAELPHLALALTATVPADLREPMLIEAEGDLPIPALAQKLTLVALGDPAGCELHVRVQDARDETFGFVVAELKRGECTTLLIPLDPAASAYHYAGDNDGTMQLPLRLQSIGLVAGAAAKAGASPAVVIDEIACELPELEAIPVELPEVDIAGGRPPWQLAGRNLGGTRLEVAADEEYPKALCSWLDFAWGDGDQRTNSFAELLRPTSLDGAKGTLFAWIKGDGSGCLCTFRLRDATGEVLQFHRLRTLTLWRNWRCVFLDTYLDHRLYWLDHWDGNNSGLIDPPLSFESIVIDDIAPSEASPEFPQSAARGRIGIGPVWFVPWTEE